MPGGTGYTEEAVIELYAMIDQISDKATREYIRTRYEGAKVRKVAAADREMAKREQQERDKRQAEARAAEMQKKQDDAIRARIRRANPFATPDQIEALLPKVREAEMLKRTLEGADDCRKADLAKWGAE